MITLLRRSVALILLAVIPLLVVAQEKSVNPGINAPYKNPDVKKITGTLEKQDREVFVQREQIVEACRLRPGMKMADVGAGTGLFTRLFANKVGPAGHVYAVDISRRLVDHIDKSCKEAGIKNVSGIVCSPSSAELPPESIDLAFICDTYHHLEFPFKTMQSIHQALRPGGQVVLVDFRRIEGKTRDWLLKHVRAGEETVIKEVTSCGFKQVEQKDFLKDNYIIRFEKIDRKK